MNVGGTVPEDVEAQVQRVVQSVRAKSAGHASDEMIERTVRDCFEERKDARIRDFVSLLAERSARERLRRLQPAQGSGAE